MRWLLNYFCLFFSRLFLFSLSIIRIRKKYVHYSSRDVIIRWIMYYVNSLMSYLIYVFVRTCANLRNYFVHFNNTERKTSSQTHRVTLFSLLILMYSFFFLPVLFPIHFQLLSQVGLYTPRFIYFYSLIYYFTKLFIYLFIFVL